MNFNISEQPLAFDRILPRDGEVPALVRDADGGYVLQLYAPQAGQVSFVMLDTEYMCDKGSDGIWRTAYPFRTGINYVQLLIDRTEVLTHLLPISYGYSKPYNYVALDTGETFYALRDVPHGSVRREYFFSSVTEEWESCLVYTPPDYDSEPKLRFPVLYLQHGHGENEVGWTAAGKVNFILDNLLAEGRIRPFVVVMSNGMVQTCEEGRGRFVDFRLFERMLLEDIIPFAESRFRAGGCRELRAMAGLSMGSLQTSLCGFTHPGLFCALGLFSGFVADIITGSELDIPGRAPSDNTHLRILDDAAAFSDHFSVFFRAMGKKDPFWPYFEQDDALLLDKGIRQIRRVYDGAHDWNVWRQCLRDFAPLLF